MVTWTYIIVCVQMQWVLSRASKNFEYAIMIISLLIEITYMEVSQGNCHQIILTIFVVFSSITIAGSCLTYFIQNVRTLKDKLNKHKQLFHIIQQFNEELLISVKQNIKSTRFKECIINKPLQDKLHQLIDSYLPECTLKFESQSQDVEVKENQIQRILLQFN